MLHEEVKDYHWLCYIKVGMSLGEGVCDKMLPNSCQENKPPKFVFDRAGCLLKAMCLRLSKSSA